MRLSKEELHREYVVNECIWNSATVVNREKAAVWRRQMLVLQDPTHDLQALQRYDLMKHHFEKLDSKYLVKYRHERLQIVTAMLSGFGMKHNKTTSISTDSFDNLAFLDNIQLEPSCHGIYESCRSLEVTDDDLQLLRNMAKLENNRDKCCTFASEKPNTSQKIISNLVDTNCKSTQMGTNKFPSGSLPQGNDCVQPTDTTKNNNPFRTAREMITIKNLKQELENLKNHKFNDGITISKAALSSNTNCTRVTAAPAYFNYGITKKILGGRCIVRSGSELPVSLNGSNSPTSSTRLNLSPPEVADERLAKIDPKMVELIQSEIMHTYKSVSWHDIAGLGYAKAIIKEAVVYPLLRPDIFTGLRRPPRGILLFGPPGTGKTLIGKCIASQSQSTFFSISASSLTSKWVGDSEKMVRALFAVAAVHQPAVVFIDEIDSLLAKRSESEHDSSRKLKNEFLVQLDGAGTSAEDRIIIVGATNRPQELDDAARRRFARRLYIPLPELESRIQILENLLKTVSNNLTKDGILQIGEGTDGYSGADMDILCREASMESLRTIPIEQIAHMDKDNIRPVTLNDFQSALQSVRPSVSRDDLAQYIKWNSEYGAVRQIR